MHWEAKQNSCDFFLLKYSIPVIGTKPTISQKYFCFKPQSNLATLSHLRREKNTQKYLWGSQSRGIKSLKLRPNHRMLALHCWRLSAGGGQGLEQASKLPERKFMSLNTSFRLWVWDFALMPPVKWGWSLGYLKPLQQLALWGRP